MDATGPAVYIDPMRTISRVLAALAVLALVAASGPALYGARPGTHTMPCCKTPARCDPGMKAAPCCTVDPASAFPGTTAVAGEDPARTGSRKASHSLCAAPAGAAADSALTVHPARLWYPPARQGSVPIYLRHLSILC